MVFVRDGCSRHLRMCKEVGTDKDQLGSITNILVLIHSFTLPHLIIHREVGTDKDQLGFGHSGRQALQRLQRLQDDAVSDLGLFALRTHFGALVSFAENYGLLRAQGQGQGRRAHAGAWGGGGGGRGLGVVGCVLVCACMRVRGELGVGWMGSAWICGWVGRNVLQLRGATASHDITSS